ncbi:MAG: hypothetical protein K6T86_12565 [Pirellulales bacterium]|jgi:hypothetical protein|nr:hypothetical protein [Pirellulales bacterium]
MRIAILLAWLGLVASACIGCIAPTYSADPVRRAQQLIWDSENLRLILDDWERIWLNDQPSHLTPYRTHGGMI